jgi:hypothetical protein
MANRTTPIATALALIVLGLSTPSALAWKFAVMGDSQWDQYDPTGNNVNTVAVNAIKACNQAFISAGVSFVVQVGDQFDLEGEDNAGLRTRLEANSDLNLAGIPYYALRGNHDGGLGTQAFFNEYFIPASTDARPVSICAADTSSYAVTVNNVKIVLLDFTSASGDSAMLDQTTSWMDEQLSLDDHQHAFVFQHRNLVGQAHKNNMFGESDDENPDQQNQFYATLAKNGVRYDISGHDHMHYRSIVTSPDGLSRVHQLICCATSSRYYTPSAPFSARDEPISNETGRIGYYIFDIDGPRVTVDFYETIPLENGDVAENPTWTLAESFGYSLNGKEFLVSAGSDFAGVADSYKTTGMSLSGTNGDVATTFDGRPVVKDINTGWTDRTGALLSEILTLWGLRDIGQSSMATAFATLTMSYDASGLVNDPHIAWKNDDGTWLALGSVVNPDGTISALISGDGDYAVVPEPSIMSLVLISGTMLVQKRASRRRADYGRP